MGGRGVSCGHQLLVGQLEAVDYYDWVGGEGVDYGDQLSVWHLAAVDCYLAGAALIG